VVCPLIDDKLRHNNVNGPQANFVNVWQNLSSITGQTHKNCQFVFSGWAPGFLQ